MRGIWSTLLICATVLAGGENASAEAGSRSKVIDFEDALVEGVNKQPLDSLSQLSDAQRRRRKVHLYRKRVGFRAETKQTLKEIRLAQ